MTLPEDGVYRLTLPVSEVREINCDHMDLNEIIDIAQAEVFSQAKKKTYVVIEITED